MYIYINILKVVRRCHAGRQACMQQGARTSFLEGGESWTTVQSVLIAWSFETSEQQKKILLQPLYLSSSHFIYIIASVDSLSASYKIIAASVHIIFTCMHIIITFWLYINFQLINTSLFLPINIYLGNCQGRRANLCQTSSWDFPWWVPEWHASHNLSVLKDWLPHVVVILLHSPQSVLPLHPTCHQTNY